MAPLDGNAWAIKAAREQERLQQVQQQLQNENKTQRPDTRFSNETTSTTTTFTHPSSLVSSRNPSSSVRRSYDPILEAALMPRPRRRVRISEETPNTSVYSVAYDESDNSPKVKRTYAEVAARPQPKRSFTQPEVATTPKANKRSSTDVEVKTKRSFTEPDIIIIPKPTAKRSFTDPIRRFKREKRPKDGGDPGPEHSYWEPDEKPSFLQALRSKLSFKDLPLLGHKPPADTSLWIRAEDYLDAVDPGWRKDIEKGLLKKHGIWVSEPKKQPIPVNPKYPEATVWRPPKYPKNYKPCTWVGPPPEDDSTEALPQSDGGCKENSSSTAVGESAQDKPAGDGAQKSEVPPVIDKASEQPRVQMPPRLHHRTGNVAQYKPLVIDRVMDVSAHQSGLLDTDEQEPGNSTEYTPLVIGRSRSGSAHSSNSSTSTVKGPTSTVKKPEPNKSTENTSLVADGSKEIPQRNTDRTASTKPQPCSDNKPEDKPLAIDSSKGISIIDPDDSTASTAALQPPHHSPKPGYEPLVVDGSQRVPSIRRNTESTPETKNHAQQQAHAINPEYKASLLKELQGYQCPTILNPGQTYSPSVYASRPASSVFNLDLRDLQLPPPGFIEPEDNERRPVPTRYSVLNPYATLVEDPSMRAPDKAPTAYPHPIQTSYNPHGVHGAAGPAPHEYSGMMPTPTRGGYAPAPPDPQYQNTASLECKLTTHITELHYHVDKTASRLSKSFEDSKNWHLDRIMKQVDEMSDIARLINAKTIAQEEMLNQTQRMMKDIRSQVAAVRQDMHSMEGRITALVREEVSKLAQGIQSLKAAGPHNPIQGETCTRLQGPEDVKSSFGSTQKGGSARQRSRLSGKGMLELKLTNVLDSLERANSRQTTMTTTTSPSATTTPTTPAAEKVPPQGRSEIPQNSAADPLVGSRKNSECAAEGRVKQSVVSTPDKGQAEPPSPVQNKTSLSKTTVQSANTPRPKESASESRTELGEVLKSDKYQPDIPSPTQDTTSPSTTVHSTTTPRPQKPASENRVEPCKVLPSNKFQSELSSPPQQETSPSSTTVQSTPTSHPKTSASASENRDTQYEVLTPSKDQSDIPSPTQQETSPSSTTTAQSTSTTRSKKSVNFADYPNLDPAIAATMRVPDLKEVWGYVRPRKPSNTKAKAEAAAPIEPLPELKTKAQLKPRNELEHKPIQKHRPHPLNLQKVNPPSQTGTEVKNDHHDRPTADERSPRTPGSQNTTEPAAAEELSAQKSPAITYSDPRKVPEGMRTALDRHFIRAIERADPSTPWEEVIRTETAKLIASKPSTPKNYHYILDLDQYDHEEVDEDSPIARHYGSQWATKKYHHWMNKDGPRRRSKTESRQKQSLGKAAKVLDFEYREDVKGFMSKKSTSSLSKKIVVPSLSKKSVASLSKKSISNLSTKSTKSAKQATASSGSSIKSTTHVSNKQATVSSASASASASASVKPATKAPSTPTTTGKPTISTPTSITAKPSNLPRPAANANVQTIVSNINTIVSNAKQQQEQATASAAARACKPSTPTTPTPTRTNMATVTTTTHTSHKASNKPRDTTYISNIPTPTGGFTRMEIAQDVPQHPDYYPRERQDIALTFRGFVDPDIKSDVIPDYYPGMFDNDPYARIVAPAPPKRVDSLVAPPADLPEYLKAYHDKLPATPDAPAVQYNRGTRHRDASIYVPEEDELV